jgi:hypothetical protein
MLFRFTHIINFIYSECSLSVTVNCTLETGHNALACGSIRPPTYLKCGGSNARQLHFIYGAQSCEASNTTSKDFKCIDSNGGPTFSTVFIKITNDGETFSYFNGTVQPGYIFGINASDALPELMRIQVFSVTSDAPDILLQTVLMSPSCANLDSDVSLLTQYGSLQLTAFENAEEGFQSAIGIIVQNFEVKNTGTGLVTLLWANITSSLYGTTALVSLPGVFIESGDSVSFPFSSTLLNLMGASGTSFTSTLEVLGSSVNNSQAPSTCSDKAMRTVTVG